jgi:hypothetical protein
VDPLAVLVVFAFLGALWFTIWMWIEALTVPASSWRAVDRSKGWYFIAWYAGGLLTAGLVPLGMSVWYYVVVRPLVRGTPRGASAPVPDRRLPAEPVASSNPYYTDAHGQQRLRPWDAVGEPSQPRGLWG